MSATLTRIRHRTSILVVAVALIAGVGWWQPWKAKSAPPALAKVEFADIEDTVRAIGTVSPKRKIDVGVRVTGQLQSLHVTLGQHVRKGELLAVIDPTIARNERDANDAAQEAAAASLESRKLDLVAAGRELDRMRRLQAAHAISEAELEQAQTAFQKAELDVRQLDIKLREAGLAAEKSRANLGYTEIRAPIEGDVVNIAVQEGQTLNAVQQAPTLLTLAQLDTMSVKALIAEADIGRVHTGQTLRYSTLGAPGSKHSGRITSLQPVGEKRNDALFFGALFDVPNGDRGLLPDMTVEVSVIVQSHPHVLSVPVVALGDLDADGRRPVKVQGPDGSVVERKLRIGIDDRIRAEVLDGVREGEQVVVPDIAPPPTTHAGQG